MALYVVGTVVLAYFAAMVVMSTERFHRFLTVRVTAGLEALTGARLEIRRITLQPYSLQMTFQGLVLHGKEPAADPPLLSAGALSVRVNPLSILGRKLMLRRFDLEDAEIHVRRYADGSTNVPGPPLDANRALDEFLNLSTATLTVSHSTLFWNDLRVPLDLSARDAAVVLHRVQARRYAGTLACSDLNLADWNWPLPLPSIAVVTRIEFSRDDLELTELQWRLGKNNVAHSGASGRGSVALRRLPRFVATASMQAKGEIPALARLFRVPELAGGTFSLMGNAAYSHGQYRSRGRVQIRDIGIESTHFKSGHITWASDYSLNQARLEFANFRLSLLGGEAQGRAQVSLEHALPTFVLRTQLRGISLAEALQTLPPGRTLVHDLSAAAVVSGGVEASWKGKLQDFTSHFSLNLSPPEGGVSASFRPLTGSMRGTATFPGTPSVTLESADFHLPHSALVAQGRLGPSQSDLVIRGQTSDFEEVRRLSEELSEPRTEIPLRLKSTATFSGSATGPWSGPVLRGRLKIGAFEFRGWKWESFTGSLVASPASAQISSGKLASGRSSLNFDIWAALEMGKLTPRCLLRLSAQAQDASLEGLEDALNLHYPATGRVSGQLRLDGTSATLAGTGAFRVEAGTLHREPFDWLTAQLRVTRAVWNVEAIELAKGKGRAQGQGWVEPLKHSFGGQLRGSGFELAGFKLLAPHRYRSELGLAEQLSGRLSFDARGQGTLEKPEVQSTVELSELAVNKVPVGSFHAQLQWQGQQIRLRADSQAVPQGASGLSPRGVPEGVLHFSGAGRAGGDWPFQFEVQYANLRVDPWIDLFRGQPLEGSVTVGGSLTAQGPLAELAHFEAQGKAENLEIVFPDFKLQNDRPVNLRYSHSRLTAGLFRLRGPSTDLQVQGSINFTSPASIAFTARGHGDANVLTILDPGIEAEGSFDLNLRGDGTLSQPNLDGAITVSGLGVAYGNVPFRVAGLNGEIKLQGDQALVSLRGSTGPSIIAVSGFATFSGPPKYDLQADLEHGRVAFPADFTSVLTGSVHLTGGPAGGRLTGDLGVAQMFVSEDFNLLAWMGELSTLVARQSAGLSSPLASNVRMDLQVRSQPQVRVESRNLDALADIDLNLRGTLADPVAFGSIHLESGNAIIRGDRYRLTRGDITMNNPVRTQVYMDVEAQTRVQDYELTLEIAGPAERTRISYRADPPLPTEDILSLLALGYTRQTEGVTSAANRPFSSIGASALLSQALSSQTSGRLQRLFGVSRIKIDPNVSGPLASGGPRVTVEERVARDFTITYSQNTSGIQQRVIQLNWDLSDKISLIGDRDQNGVFGLELRFRRRFR